MFNHIPVIVVVMYSAAFVAASGVTAGDEPAVEKISAERQAILADMRTAVAAMKVSEKTGDTIQPARVVEEPIFRYSDPQREIIDGTMWVWTIDDLPVMTMKLECCSLPEPERRWLFNVGSTSSKLIDVKWPFAHRFESRKPGLKFQQLEAGPKLSESKSGRLLQLKQLSRKFSATMLGAAGPDDKSEMRLLPTPLFRYSSKVGHIADGALFGLERHRNESGCDSCHSVARRWNQRPLGIRLHGNHKWRPANSPGRHRGLVTANSGRPGTRIRNMGVVLLGTHQIALGALPTGSCLTGDRASRLC